MFGDEQIEILSAVADDPPDLNAGYDVSFRAMPDSESLLCDSQISRGLPACEKFGVSCAHSIWNVIGWCHCLLPLKVAQCDPRHHFKSCARGSEGKEEFEKKKAQTV